MKTRLTLFRRICRLIIAYEWLLLGVILPFVLFPSATRSLVLLLIPLLWVVRKVATGHFVPPTPVDWPLLLMLFMVLVSLLATFNMAHSFPKIAGMVYGTAVFYAAVAWIAHSSQRLWLSVALLLLVGLGIAALALVGVNLISKFPGLRQLVALLPQWVWIVPGRETGINPNEIGGALLWVLPLAVALFVGNIFRRSEGEPGPSLPVLLLAGLAIVILGLTLLLTQSRSALLGFGVAVLTMTMVVVWQKSRLLFGVGLSAVAVGGAFLITRVGPAGLANLLFPPLGLNSDLVTTTSMADRLEIWSRAIYGVQDFPLTGMGMNNFREVVHVLYPLFFVDPNLDIGHAHNHWLQAALDLGLAGMVAYLAVWLGLAAMLWRSWRAADYGQRPLLLGFGGCLTAFFVYGLTDTIALGARPGFIWWFLAGLITALHAQVFAAARADNGSADGR